MGKLLSVKISNGKGMPAEFKNKLNMSDPKQVALMLGDLESHGAPISKAISEFKKNGENQFPW